MKEHDKFPEVHELMSRDFYDYYRKNRKKTAPAINQYNYFVKAINGLFQEFKTAIIETNGGVDIKGLGYFCKVREKDKMRNTFEKNPLKKFKKYHCNRFWFYPNEDIKDWNLFFKMDGDFSSDKEYFVIPESAKTRYEIEEFNKKLSKESKDIKFIK